MAFGNNASNSIGSSSDLSQAVKNADQQTSLGNHGGDSFGDSGKNKLVAEDHETTRNFVNAWLTFATHHHLDFVIEGIADRQLAETNSDNLIR